MAKVSLLSKGVNVRALTFSIPPGDEVTVEENEIDDNVKELIKEGRIVITKGSIKGVKNKQKSEALEELKLKEGNTTLSADELKIFLDQNAKTVIKTLKESHLSKADLMNLRIYEAANKKRRKVLLALNAFAGEAEEDMEEDNGSKD